MSFEELNRRRDLRNARAAGMESASKLAGETLLALVDDTVRKLNSAGFGVNEVTEDLLGRLVEISKKFGADADLFWETAGQYENRTYEYEIGEKR